MKSDCRHARAFADGHLTEQMSRRYQEHAENCPDCATVVRRERRVDEAVRTWAESCEVQSDALTCAHALVREVEQRSGAPRWTSPRVALLVTASLLAVLLVGPWLKKPSDEPITPTGGGGEFAMAGDLAGRELPAHQDAGDTGGPGSGSTEGTHFAAAPDAALRFESGSDRMVLAPGAQARMHSKGGTTDVLLEEGTIWVDAGPRTEGETLNVHTGDVVVTVVGTRFSVAQGPGRELIDVRVLEGTVAVFAGGAGRRLVEAGDYIRVDVRSRRGPQFSRGSLSEREWAQLAEVFSAPIAKRGDDTSGRPEGRRGNRGRAKAQTPGRATDSRPGPGDAARTGEGSVSSDLEPNDARRDIGDPSLEELRRQLLAGENERVKQALVRRLNTSPRDSDARWLLAEAHRRSGEVDKAIAQFEELAAVAGPALANRSRFRAADLLSRSPLSAERARARRLLRAYLSHRPAPLSDSAILKLAELLDATSEASERAELLRSIVRDYPGSMAAARAKQLLER